MYHGRQKLNVNNMCEVSRFFEIVKTSHFHELTNDFVCDLKVVNVLVELALLRVNSSIIGHHRWST